MSGVLTNGDVGTIVVGIYGSLVLNANGSWTYTLDNTNPLTNALAQGAHASDIFSYTESDGHGGTSTTTLTIDITGTNDAPVVVAALTDSVNEGVAAFTRNLLNGASDVDQGETATLYVGGVTYAVNGGAASGTAPAGVSLGADGHTLTVDPADPAFDHLAVGEHATIVVSYRRDRCAGCDGRADRDHHDQWHQRCAGDFDRTGRRDVQWRRNDDDFRPFRHRPGCRHTHVDDDDGRQRFGHQRGACVGLRLARRTSMRRCSPASPTIPRARRRLRPTW